MELLAVSEELGRSPAQVAVRWVLEQPTVTSAIVGARTVAHAHDNFLAGEWKMPDDVLLRLNSVSQQPHKYPYEMEWNMDERRASAIDMPSLSE